MDLPIPRRVLFVAAAIIVGLGVLWWLVVESSPGSAGDPAAPPPPAVEEPEGIAPGSAAGPEGLDAGAPTDAARPDEAALPEEAGESTEVPGEAAGESAETPGEAAGEAGSSATRAAAEAEIPTERVTFSLYYPRDGATRLEQVVRRLEAPLSVAAQAEEAMRLLASPPEGTLSPFPPGIRVREVWVAEHGVAYVDLGGEIGSLSGGSLAELHAVYSIVNTLTTSFPQIQAVQILVEGQEVETLTGHVDLSRPIRRSADW